MPFSDLTILYFQMAAAALMGWDYFTPKSWRQQMDEFLGRYFGGVQQNVDKDIVGAWSFLKDSMTKIVISLFSFGLAYLLLKMSSAYSGDFKSEIVLITGFFYLLLVAGGFLTLLNIIMPLLVPLGVGGVFRGITTFLTSTEKGPMSGLGFLALLVSFVMRYINYTAT